MSKELKIYFLLPPNVESETETTEEFQQAFEACRQNQMLPEFMREAETDTVMFDKKDIVVFEKFEGETFDKLTKTKSLIVGPQCLLKALIDGINIPNNGSPVYNLAMYGLKVSVTSFSVEHKAALRKKIEYMGGKFFPNITSYVTHLVSNGVKSDKYVIANTNGISVMSESWIDAVWNASLTKNIKATDDEFMLNHKCPTFDKLSVCSTGLDEKERQRIWKLIEQHGGHFSGKMTVTKTHMLICNPGTCSEKFKVAQQQKIPCVSSQWVYDSIEEGYALPETKYTINISSSTPTKTGVPKADFSMMSMISGHTADLHADPNVTLNSSTVSIYNKTNLKLTTTKSATKVSSVNKFDDMVDNINLPQMKQAGPFLEECGIYLTGFCPARREKLCRVLKLAGATRYDNISDKISQIIVGDINSHELKLFAMKGNMAPMVSVEWLTESIAQKQPVAEDLYLVNANIASVPTSFSPLKTGFEMNFLKCNTSASQPIIQVEQNEMPEQTSDISIMKQYLTNNKEGEEEDTLVKLIKQGQFNEQTERKEETKQKEVSKLTEDTTVDEETLYPIFKDKSFLLLGFNMQDYENLSEIIEMRCGLVKESSSYKGVVDYLVIQTFSGSVKHTAIDVVNDLWVFDCHLENKLLEPQYFHQPIDKNHDSKPLVNSCISISGYSKYERVYLGMLIRHLGGIYQEKLARLPIGDITSSTHLVSLETNSNKYKAAFKWNIPIVTHEWILECQRQDKKVNENPFRVVDAQREESNLEAPINKTRVVNEKIDKDNVTSKIDKINKNKIPVTETVEQHQISNNVVERKNNDGPFTGFEEVSIHNSFLACQEIHKEATLIEEVDEMGSGTPVRRNTTYSGDKSNITGSQALFTDDEPKPSTSKESMQGNINHVTKVDGYKLMIDGEQITIDDYMQKLRDQGLFDVGSPVANYDVSPFVMPSDIKVGEAVCTPKRLFKSDSGNDSMPSQETPVGKYIRGLQQKNLLPTTPRQTNTPDSPLPKTQFDVDTPETPLGAFMCEDRNPSPETRKYWLRRLNRFPHYKCHDRPASKERRKSTPLSEVKRQAWNMLLSPTEWSKKAEHPENYIKKMKFDDSDDNDENEPLEVNNKEESESQAAENIQVSNQLAHLQNLMKSKSSSGSRNSLLCIESNTPQRTHLSHQQNTAGLNDGNKDSQTDTVGWDDPSTRFDVVATDSKLVHRKKEL